VVNSRLLLACLAGAALPLLSSSCDILSPQNEWKRLEQALDRNRRRWERQDVQSYSFVLSESCECIPSFEGPARVWVVGGVVVRVERVSDGEPVREEIREAWGTVDDFFDRIAYAIDKKAAFLEVEYDKARGFATRIEMDLRAERVDDEMVAEISGFRLEEGGP